MNEQSQKLREYVLEDESELKNKWIINQPSYEMIESIKSKYKLSYLTAFTVASRGISFSEVESFIDPKIKNFWINPAELPDIQEGIALIKEAIKNNETIGVFGDYDVDGVSSCAIWKETLDLFNAKSEIWVPKRSQGYGPSQEALEHFENKKIKTLIIVDCGSSSHDFIEKYSGKTVIIDHHPCDEMVKSIVINPFKPTKNYNKLHDFQKMCAAGLSLMVVWELLRKSPEIDENKKKQHIISILDLAAIATVCDIMEFNGINRAIVATGIKVIESQKRVGLKALINQTDLYLPIISRDIAFNIGPRLNATGRLNNAHLSYELLIEKNESEAIKKSIVINNMNEERKTLQDIALEEAIEMAQKYENEKVLFLASENWHGGIIGIIAGSIKDKFKKPVVIGNIEGNEIKASSRSPRNSINIGALIQQGVQEKIITKGGGHAQAAGLSCTLEEWENFKQWSKNVLKEEVFEQNPICIDAIIEMSQIDPDYKKISPYGLKNPEVKILTKNLKFLNITKTKHSIKCLLEQNGKTYFVFAYIFKNEELSKAIENAYKERLNFNAVITLNDKNKYHNIQDIKVI